MELDYELDVLCVVHGDFFGLLLPQNKMDCQSTVSLPSSTSSPTTTTCGAASEVNTAPSHWACGGWWSPQNHHRFTCTRTPCEYWHPPECQFYNTKMGCQSGDKCTFPHYKVDEQANKGRRKATSKKEEEARTKPLWLLWTVSHNWVVYHMIQMHSFLKVESLGETRCKKSLGTNSKGTIL